jgi:hypothetical protein
MAHSSKLPPEFESRLAPFSGAERRKLERAIKYRLDNKKTPADILAELFPSDEGDQTTVGQSFGQISERPERLLEESNQNHAAPVIEQEQPQTADLLTVPPAEEMSPSVLSTGTDDRGRRGIVLDRAHLFAPRSVRPGTTRNDQTQSVSRLGQLPAVGDDKAPKIDQSLMGKDFGQTPPSPERVSSSADESIVQQDLGAIRPGPVPVSPASIPATKEKLVTPTIDQSLAGKEFGQISPSPERVSSTPDQTLPMQVFGQASQSIAPQISFEIPQRWVLGHQPEPEQPKATEQLPPPSICPRAAAQAIICGIGVAVCTPSLIVLQAIAGGSTVSAWYWSGITEVAALVLLIYPVRSKGFRWLLKSAALRFMGLAFLGLGYLVMHTSIAGTTSQGVATVVSSSDEVKEWEKEVARLEREIEPVQKSIEALNPTTHPSQIAKLKASIDTPSKALSAARIKLSDARGQAKVGTSVDVVESWGLVEWLRRAGLMILNTLSGHGLLAAMALLTPPLLHRFRTRKN